MFARANTENMTPNIQPVFMTPIITLDYFISQSNAPEVSHQMLNHYRFHSRVPRDAPCNGKPLFNAGFLENAGRELPASFEPFSTSHLHV